MISDKVRDNMSLKQMKQTKNLFLFEELLKFIFDQKLPRIEKNAKI